MWEAEQSGCELRWSTGIGIGKGLLYLLVFIHLILPWMPADQSDEDTIVVGALDLRSRFLLGKTVSQ